MAQSVGSEFKHSSSDTAKKKKKLEIEIKISCPEMHSPLAFP
jgi:hypothetical protein